MARLIRISEASALGLHVMVLMAGAREKPLPTGAAASRLGVSGAHLSKVLQRLGRAGLVKSIRGPEGGFTLAKKSGAISLLDVYEAIEGRCEKSACLFGAPACGGTRCILGGVLEKADGAMRAYLGNTTLADLAGIYKEGKSNGEEKKNHGHR
ncbi:MAG: Rrf2 family transcriptional regulator [Candidatus Aureabacteria bacterium]|nr:Rrf2 family transcriptional regulator [Candidatus Auribacterota bacterium]